jgi:hypothetical protein
MKEAALHSPYTPTNVSLELTDCMGLAFTAFIIRWWWRLVIAKTHILLFVLLLLLFLFGLLLFLVLLALFFRLNRQLVLDVILITVKNNGQSSLGSVVLQRVCAKKRRNGRPLDSYEFLIYVLE